MNKKDHEALPRTLPMPGTDVLFQQTLPRRLVHRAAVSQVLLTSLVDHGDDAYHLGAQWPRSHHRLRLHDPILLAETIRQAALAIAHQFYDVPLSSQFLMTEIAYDVSEEGLRLNDVPAEIVLTAAPHSIHRRGHNVTGMSIDVNCYRDGYQVGSGSASWQCVSAVVYARLRGDHRNPVPLPPPVAVDPHLVGRCLTDDVVLAPSETDNQWRVRVDTSHPVMFDHKVDHVPGMVAVEAARQAALLATGTANGVPVRGRFIFDQFIELDEPCVVTAAPGSTGGVDTRVPVHVKLEQDGRVTVTGELDILVRS
jgi:2-oxo-3-(phosphooxy)propyl 3-oxoalkanoate synthase